MLYKTHTMGHKILRFLIFAIIPAIRKNKFPQNFTVE